MSYTTLYPAIRSRISLFHPSGRHAVASATNNVARPQYTSPCVCRLRVNAIRRGMMNEHFAKISTEPRHCSRCSIDYSLSHQWTSRLPDLSGRCISLYVVVAGGVSGLTFKLYPSVVSNPNNYLLPVGTSKTLSPGPDPGPPCLPARSNRPS